MKPLEAVLGLFITCQFLSAVAGAYELQSSTPEIREAVSMVEIPELLKMASHGIDIEWSQSSSDHKQIVNLSDVCPRLMDPQDLFGIMPWRFAKMILPQALKDQPIKLKLGISCGLWRIALRKKNLFSQRPFLFSFHLIENFNHLMSLRNENESWQSQSEFENSIALEYAKTSLQGNAACTSAWMATMSDSDLEAYKSICHLPFLEVEQDGGAAVSFSEIGFDQIQEVEYLLASPGDTLASRFGHAMLTFTMCRMRTYAGEICPRAQSLRVVYSFNIDVTENMSFGEGFKWGLTAKLYALDYESVANFYQSHDQNLYHLPLPKLSIAEKMRLLTFLTETKNDYSGKWHHLANNCTSHLWRALIVALNMQRSSVLLSKKIATPNQLYYAIKSL